MGVLKQISMGMCIKDTKEICMPRSPRWNSDTGEYDVWNEQNRTFDRWNKDTNHYDRWNTETEHWDTWDNETEHYNRYNPATGKNDKWNPKEQCYERLNPITKKMERVTNDKWNRDTRSYGPFYEWDYFNKKYYKVGQELSGLLTSLYDLT